VKLIHKNIALAISVVIILGACTPKKTAEDYIVSAQKNLQQNELNTAIIALKNAIKLSPTNTNARFLLGQAYAKQGLWLAAEKELVKALNDNINDGTLLPLLAEVYYHLNDSQGIESLLEEYQGNNDVVLQSLRYFLAASLVLENQITAAKEQFTQLTKLPDASLYKDLSYVWLNALSKDFSTALAEINRLLVAYPKLDLLHELHAKTLFAANKMADAATAFEYYLQLRPQDHQNRLIYALALTGSKQWLAAEQQADLLYKLTPNNILVNQIKAQTRFADNDFTKAKEFAERALQGKNDLLMARVIAGISAYQLKQAELAYTHLEAIKDQLPFSHPARRLLTVIRFQLGYSDENFNELASAPLQAIDSKILAVSARELFKIGQVEKATTLIKKASQVEPDNAQLLYQQGVLKLLENNDASTELFKAALAKDPNFDAANIALIMQLISSQQYNEALKKIAELKDNKPTLAYTLQGKLYLHQKHFAKAQAAFEQVVKTDKQNLVAFFNLGKIAEQQGKRAQAVSYYQKILAINSQHIPAMSALLQLSLQPEVAAKIKVYFEEQLSAKPKEAIASFMLAKFYLAQKDITKAKAVITEGLVYSPKAYSLLLLLAKIEADLNNYEAALAYLNEISNNFGDNALLYEYKAKVYLQKKNITKAIQSLKQAIKLAPNRLDYQLSVIKLYIKQGEISVAKQLLIPLADKLPTHNDILVLQGRIALLEHDYSKAVALLTKVNQPHNEDIILLLAEALQKAGTTDKALALINNYDQSLKVTKVNLPIKLRLKQAELYSEISPEKAISLYKTLLQQTNNYYVFNNNLAWLYLQQNQPDKALKSASLAFEAAPQNDAVKDTYALALIAAGQTAKAEILLKELITLAPKNLSYKVHYAQALMANNKKTDVDAVLANINVEQLSQDARKRYFLIKNTYK
jgi:putative PEP-CTERM system TPR-repeat lipoprotein